MMRIRNGSEIKAIIYDFDGVMTDNRVLLDENGIEAAFVNRSDGYAISQIKKMNVAQIIISTEVNSIVIKRAEKLGIEVINDVSDKRMIVDRYCREHGLDLENVMYVGNDINDLSAMELVGYKCAPADAEEEILAIADWISSKKGGYGVIRDLYNYLLCGGF